jgi:hypothetical protein
MALTPTPVRGSRTHRRLLLPRSSGCKGRLLVLLRPPPLTRTAGPEAGFLLSLFLDTSGAFSVTHGHGRAPVPARPVPAKNRAIVRAQSASCQAARPCCSRPQHVCGRGRGVGPHFSCVRRVRMGGRGRRRSGRTQGGRASSGVYVVHCKMCLCELTAMENPFCNLCPSTYIITYSVSFFARCVECCFTLVAGACTRWNK